MFFCFTPVKYINFLVYFFGNQNAKRRTYPILYGTSVPYYVIGNKIIVLVVKRIVSIFVATVACHFSFSFRFDKSYFASCAILSEIITYFFPFVNTIVDFYLNCGVCVG